MTLDVQVAATSSPLVFEQLDTTRRSILHLFFLRRASNGVYTTRFHKPLIFACSFLVTYLSLLLLAFLEPTLTLRDPQLKLPFLYDWNLLLMFVVTLPTLIVYSVTDQVTLTSALGQIVREGIVELPGHEAEMLCSVWERRFAIVNLSGQAIGVVMGIVIALLNYLAYKEVDGYWIFDNNQLTLTGGLFLCDVALFFAFIPLYVIRSIAIGMFLKAIVTKAAVKIVPFHPDHCGGLRPVGAIGLRNQYLLSVYGLNVLSFIMLIRYLGATTSLLHFLMIVAAVAYVLVGPIVFAGPLAPFRDGMMRTKRELMNEVAQRLRREFARIRENLRSGDVSKEDEEVIQRLQRIGDLIESLPVWPFDARTVRKFLTVYVVPIAGSVPIITTALRSLNWIR